MEGEITLEIPEPIIKKPIIKRKRKRKKKKVYNPILKDDLDEKIKYLNKRIYYCKNDDKKTSYKNKLEKLKKRPVIE